MSAARSEPAGTAKNAASQKLHVGMRVAEITALVPGAADVMSEYGLHCFSCALGGQETLAEAAVLHGFSEEQLTELIDDLEQVRMHQPTRPTTLIITPAAARGFLDIAKSEGGTEHMLRVIVDERGGFCLEFTASTNDDDATFACAEVPELTVCADPLTLGRIGGSTIDLRDGMFKLDIPEESQACCNPASPCSCSGHATETTL